MDEHRIKLSDTCVSVSLQEGNDTDFKYYYTLHSMYVCTKAFGRQGFMPFLLLQM